MFSEYDWKHNSQKKKKKKIGENKSWACFDLNYNENIMLISNYI